MSRRQMEAREDDYTSCVIIMHDMLYIIASCVTSSAGELSVTCNDSLANIVDCNCYSRVLTHWNQTNVLYGGIFSHVMLNSHAYSLDS